MTPEPVGIWPYSHPCPHWLIRLTDPAGRLLYAGVTYKAKSVHYFTGNLRRKRAASWWSEVAKIETVEYRNRHEALMAQVDAINNEHPKYGPRMPAENEYRHLVR